YVGPLQPICKDQVKAGLNRCIRGSSDEQGSFLLLNSDHNRDGRDPQRCLRRTCCDNHRSRGNRYDLTRRAAQKIRDEKSPRRDDALELRADDENGCRIEQRVQQVDVQKLRNGEAPPLTGDESCGRRTSVSDELLVANEVLEAACVCERDRYPRRNDGRGNRDRRGARLLSDGHYCLERRLICGETGGSLLTPVVSPSRTARSSFCSSGVAPSAIPSTRRETSMR